MTRVAPPSPAEPVADGTVCRCGAGPHSVSPDRCANGHVQPGNALAHRTGLYAQRGSPEMADLEAAGADLYEASINDAGGRENLTARALTQHENRAVIQVHIRKVVHALETHGLFDKRGRLRTGWISQLESLVGTALAIDRTLGLDRKARALDLQDRLTAAFGKREGDR